MPGMIGIAAHWKKSAARGRHSSGCYPLALEACEKRKKISMQNDRIELSRFKDVLPGVVDRAFCHRNGIWQPEVERQADEGRQRLWQNPILEGRLVE